MPDTLAVNPSELGFHEVRVGIQLRFVLHGASIREPLDVEIPAIVEKVPIEAGGLAGGLIGFDAGGFSVIQMQPAAPGQKGRRNGPAATIRDKDGRPGGHLNLFFQRVLGKGVRLDNNLDVGSNVSGRCFLAVQKGIRASGVF